MLPDRAGHAAPLSRGYLRLAVRTIDSPRDSARAAVGRGSAGVVVVVVVGLTMDARRSIKRPPHGDTHPPADALTDGLSRIAPADALPDIVERVVSDIDEIVREVRRN